MIEIPSYPLTKPKESDAYEDWKKLLNTSFVNLFEHKPWKSRSVIDDDYCYDYIIKKSNIVAFQFHPEKSGLLGLRLLKATTKKFFL